MFACFFVPLRSNSENMVRNLLLVALGGAVGSLGDILTYPIDVDPDLNISKMQLLDAILKELSTEGFTESDASDFWSDFDRSASRRVTLA